MVIVLYDGSRLKCSKVEISTDGENLFVDEYRIVPILEVLRIISK